MCTYVQQLIVYPFVANSSVPEETDGMYFMAVYSNKTVSIGYAFLPEIDGPISAPANGTCQGEQTCRICLVFASAAPEE